MAFVACSSLSSSSSSTVVVVQRASSTRSCWRRVGTHSSSSSSSGDCTRRWRLPNCICLCSSSQRPSRMPRSSCKRSSSDKPVVSAEVDSPPVTSDKGGSSSSSNGADRSVGEREEQQVNGSVQAWVAAAGSALAASVLVAGLDGTSLRLPDGLIEASTLTFFSEIGDKTFFIALVLAARDPVYRWVGGEEMDVRVLCLFSEE